MTGYPTRAQAGEEPSQLPPWPIVPEIALASAWPPVRRLPARGLTAPGLQLPSGQSDLPPPLPAGTCVSWVRPAAAVAVGFGAGAVPFANIGARVAAGVDLRSVGSGTVSGSGLYEVAGKGPLIVIGLLELAKGAVGPAIAGRHRPVASALAGAAAVAGHNWSPYIGGAGGRGISPAMGALLVSAPAGAGVLLAGLALGKMAGETALGSLVADAFLVPVAGRVHGWGGRLAASAVLVPIVAKRLTGNGPPQQPGPSVYMYRLLFDRDTREKLAPEERSEEPTGTA
jgi:acyl phosphate:glycerol-3-phosphate acyltransferase